MTALAFAILLVVAIGGYLFNRRAATALQRGGTQLHSIPQYHGLFSGLTVFVPILVLILCWLVLQGPVVDRLVMAGLPEAETAGLTLGERQLLQAEIVSISGGRVFGTPPNGNWPRPSE